MSKYPPHDLKAKAMVVVGLGRKDRNYKELVKRVSNRSGLSIPTTINKIQELSRYGATN